MPTIWTDDPVTTSTPVKAAHITELRGAVNSARQSVHLDPYPWTNSVTEGTIIKARDFSELRQTIQDLWFRKAMGPLPDWGTDTPPSPNTPIRASHVNDLRSWFNAFENNQNLPDPQGIISLGYEPDGNGGNGTVVGSAWCATVRALKPSPSVAPPQTPRRLLIVATKVKAKDASTPIDHSKYVSAYNRWKDALWQSGVVDEDFSLIIPWEFYPIHDSSEHPNATLSDNGRGMSNPYIENFVSRLDSFAQEVIPFGIRSFRVWNEPQTSRVSSGAFAPEPKLMAPENFASLIYRACSVLKARGATYAFVGSLNTVPFVTGPDEENVLFYDYLVKFYQHLKNEVNHVFSYPWSGFSLTMENEVRRTQQANGYTGEQWVNAMIKVITDVTNLQCVNDPNNSIILGEWGLRPDEVPDVAGVPEKLAGTFDLLRSKFSTMYWFRHNYVDDPLLNERYGIINSEEGVENDEVVIVPGSENHLLRMLTALYAPLE